MSAVPQLKLLINLARIDGQVADREQHYITTIGVANGMSENEIQPLFEKTHDPIMPSDLTDDQKFDILFSLVQLMKIDERLYKDEIKYCSVVAAKLGYDPEVMFEMMLNVRSAAMQPNEIDMLKKLIGRYLKS
jgi:hypothetical protein